MKQIETKYKVLEVKESLLGDSAIYIICEKDGFVQERRRVRIPRWKKDIYETAQLLVKDDIFIMKEDVLGTEENPVRVIRALLVCFQREDVTVSDAN